MEHALTRYRSANNLSMEAFGNLIGASKSMVSKWESRAASPRRQYLEKIFAVTEGRVTPNDFILTMPATGDAA